MSKETIAIIAGAIGIVFLFWVLNATEEEPNCIARLKKKKEKENG